MGRNWSACRRQTSWRSKGSGSGSGWIEEGDCLGRAARAEDIGQVILWARGRSGADQLVLKYRQMWDEQETRAEDAERARLALLETLRRWIDPATRPELPVNAA